MEGSELYTFEIFQEDHKEGVTPVRNEAMDVFSPWSFFTFTTYFKSERGGGPRCLPSCWPSCHGCSSKYLSDIRIILYGFKVHIFLVIALA